MPRRRPGRVAVRADSWLRKDDRPVLRGLALNPSLPDGLLLRLVQGHGRHAADGLRRRPGLPSAVVQAMLHHPDAQVRGALAANPHVDIGIRAHLADDPEFKVVLRLGAEPGEPLPERAAQLTLSRFVLLADRGRLDEHEFRFEVLESLYRDPRLRAHAARHPSPRVRLVTCDLVRQLDEPSRQALLNDDVPEVRQAAAEQLAYVRPPLTPAELAVPDERLRSSLLQLPLTREAVDVVVAGDDEDDLYWLAYSPTTPPDVIAALLGHPSARVRHRLALRPDLTGAQVSRLLADPDVAVRTAASVHPHLTEEQRAGADIDPSTDETGRCPYGAHRVSCFHQPFGPLPTVAESIGYARSAHPLLRRRAACDPRLPADEATRLAGDDDQGVRVLLALCHPAPPPELLLQVFLSYRGCGWTGLAAHPRFPTRGLAHLADHPEAAVRVLVARDPGADPAVVTRLSTDPDDGVRGAMAACPLLPVTRIIELLNDPAAADSAAANPALPVPVLAQLLDLAAAHLGEDG